MHALVGISRSVHVHVLTPGVMVHDLVVWCPPVFWYLGYHITGDMVPTKVLRTVELSQQDVGGRVRLLETSLSVPEG